MRTASFALAALTMIGCSGGGTDETHTTGTSTETETETPDAGPVLESIVLDPEITTLIDGVDASSIGDSIAKLSGFTTRNLCSDNTAGSDAIGGARDWIAAQLEATSGLTVELDPFTYGGCAGGTITRENVVAYKLGDTHPDRLIVIGGHYDSRTIGVHDGTSPAPGANDSGSQTALVLEVARVLAGASHDATLVFIAFAGEEQGLLGSKAFATGYTKYFSAGATIEAMLNCDIVGGDNTVNDAVTLQQFRLFSPGTPREIVTPEGTTDDTSPARGLMRHVATWGGAYVESMEILPQLREDRPNRGGDHESFLDEGIPAVRFIETVESPNAGTVDSHQHSPNDLMMYVTPEYTARMAQVVIASAASLARAPSPPQGITVSRTGSLVTVTWTAPVSGSAVDHYVVAGRATTENFYRPAIVVPKDASSASVTVGDLGLSDAPAFFVSVAAVDAAGHRSLFAYPEYRCDANGCIVQPDSLDVKAKD